jgi:hypothetical protein
VEEDEPSQHLINVKKAQQEPMRGSWLLEYWKDNIVVEFFPKNNKEEQDEE